MLAPDAMRRELAAIESATTAPYGVNFFCHTVPAPDAAREAAWRGALAPYYREYGIDPQSIPAGPGRLPFSDEAADVLKEFRPRVVSFHFGIPTPELLRRVKATGAKVLASATTVAEARWLEARGVDAIIAQGLEAGGHRGIFLSDDLTTQVGTMALVPQLVDATGLPVLAAGGIMDGRGIVAALALGAQAAVMGTAFLTCHESAIPQAWKTRVRSTSDTSTSVTRAITGRHARGIRNPLMQRLSEAAQKIAPYPVQNALTQELRQTASRAENGDYLSLWSGQGAPMGRARREGLGAAELMGQLEHEWREATARIAAFKR
jgi:nitronate monooxygenase